MALATLLPSSYPAQLTRSLCFCLALTACGPAAKPVDRPAIVVKAYQSEAASDEETARMVAEEMAAVASNTVRPEEAPTAGVSELGELPLARGNAMIRDISVSNLSELSPAFISSMQKGFQKCYARLLLKDQNSTGRVELKARIGSSGTVGSVWAKSPESLRTATPCLKAVVREQPFPRPYARTGTISFTVELN